MTWPLSYCAIMLAFFDLLIAIKTIRKYTTFGEPGAVERFMFSASLDDIIRVRVRMVSFVFMLNVAGATRWLP